MRMAHDVGYWDTDVIPEDWHMFLKCFYRLGDVVEVEPIHLPIGNDGALSHTPKATYINQYLQVQRWAWGAVDVPYAFEHAVRSTDIPLHKRMLRFWYFFENHIMWSTQWFFITLGGFIPMMYWVVTGTELVPGWFYIYNLLGQPDFLPPWLQAITENITVTTIVLGPTLFFYFFLIATDRGLRPPAPPMSLVRRASNYLYWLVLPPITFFFSALPALDSQVRLLIGRRMEYRVTEKV
jgi:hypothetical protein